MEDLGERKEAAGEEVRRGVASVESWGKENEAGKRRRWRWWATAYIGLLGVALIFWFDHWEIDGIRAPYVGYFCLGIAALAACGVNVFRGGPLDKRLDK